MGSVVLSGKLGMRVRVDRLFFDKLFWSPVRSEISSPVAKKSMEYSDLEQPAKAVNLIKIVSGGFCGKTVSI